MSCPAGEGEFVINKRASDITIGDHVWTMSINSTAATPATVQGKPIANYRRHQSATWLPGHTLELASIVQECHWQNTWASSTH